MDAIMPWLTPAVVIAVGAWLRADLGGRMDWTDKRIDALDKRLDNAVNGLRADIAAVHMRIDGAVRELRADIAGVNARIDAVLLADRDRGGQSRGAA